MSLINSIEEILKFTNAISLATFPDDVKPSFERVEDSVIADILGYDQLAALQAAYTANPNLTGSDASLWTAVCKVLVPLAIVDYMGNTIASTNSAGTSESVGDRTTGARLWVTNLKRDTLLANADRAMENLYAFLERNKADYALWVGSSAYTEYKGLLMQNVAQFEDKVSIGSSRRLFIRLRPTIKLVEEKYIRQIIGDDFYDYLIDQLKDTPTAEELKAIDYLRSAIAHLTMYECSLPLQFNEFGVSYAISDMQYGGTNSSRTVVNEVTLDRFKAKSLETGNAFIAKAKKYLDDNASSGVFDLYYSSTLYTDPATKTLSSDNDSLNNIFVL